MDSYSHKYKPTIHVGKKLSKFISLEANIKLNVEGLLCVVWAACASAYKAVLAQTYIITGRHTCETEPTLRSVAGSDGPRSATIAIPVIVGTAGTR